MEIISQLASLQKATDFKSENDTVFAHGVEWTETYCTSLNNSLEASKTPAGNHVFTVTAHSTQFKEDLITIVYDGEVVFQHRNTSSNTVGGPFFNIHTYELAEYVEPMLKNTSKVIFINLLNRKIKELTYQIKGR